MLQCEKAIISTQTQKYFGKQLTDLIIMHTVWKSTIKHDHTKNFREMNSLVIALISRKNSDHVFDDLTFPRSHTQKFP